MTANLCISVVWVEKKKKKKSRPTDPFFSRHVTVNNFFFLALFMKTLFSVGPYKLFQQKKICFLLGQMWSTACRYSDFDCVIDNLVSNPDFSQR